MSKKITVSCMIALCFASVLSAKIVKADIERGFRFGDVVDNNQTNLKKASQKDLLIELVKLNRDQLKVQKEIRDILQDEYAPKPKMMTLADGTKCIENSSSKCFKMPMINEIKKIPVYVKAYTERTLKAMKEKEMWEGKYVSEVLKLAYLKGQAIRELGPKYPLATRPAGTINTIGYDSIVMNKFKKSLVDEQMYNFEINIFIGLNKSLDMYSLVRLAYLIRDNKSWKINLIFNSNSSKNNWEKQYKNFYASKYFKNVFSTVQPQAFKDFKVYTTPSLFLKDIKMKKDTLIFVGRATEADIVSRMISYMIEHKYIKRNDLTAEKAWKSNSSESVVEGYYKNTLGINYEK